jgi:hypothetical protein
MWSARHGYQLVRPRDNDSRLKLICDFVLPRTEPPVTFGGKPAAEITTGDIEADRHHTRAQKRSPVMINHDLKLLRKMFACGIRERLLTSTPFKIGSENAIRLDPESPREERLTSEEAEESCSTRPIRTSVAFLRRCWRRAVGRERSCRCNGGTWTWWRVKSPSAPKRPRRAT